MKVQNVRVKMVRENIGEYTVKDFSATLPERIAEVVDSVFELSTDTQESVVAIYLDSKHKIIGMDRITTGTINSSIISPKDVFQRGLLINASKVILSHNHPSSNTEPSQDDIDLTKRMIECGKMLDMPVLDHVIVGRNYDDRLVYTSIRGQGLASF